VALVVTEAGTNLIKHAGGGEILLGTVTRPAGTGIEIIAVDSGQELRTSIVAWLMEFLPGHAGQWTRSDSPPLVPF